MLSAAGGYELLTIAHVKTAWKKFKELLSVLSSRHLSFKTGGHMASIWIEESDWLKIRNGHGILIYSAGQGLILCSETASVFTKFHVEPSV